jgi:hypothetical protein
MKRLVLFMALASMTLFGVGVASADTSGLPGSPGGFNGMLYFIAGCATFVSPTQPPLPGAICSDTVSGGTYVSNSAGTFVVAGTDFLRSNGGAGQTTATTAFFPADGTFTSATTETVPMELIAAPVPSTIKSLTCYDSAAPGAGNSDAYTVRAGTAGAGFVAVGSMATTLSTCSISGATAKSCNSVVNVAVAANTAIDIQDTTTGTPAARNIGCVLQLDVL